MFKITNSLSDEGRNFNGIWLINGGTKVLDCQHGKDSKASAKMKAKENKVEKRRSADSSF